MAVALLFSVLSFIIFSKTIRLAPSSSSIDESHATNGGYLELSPTVPQSLTSMMSPFTDSERPTENLLSHQTDHKPEGNRQVRFSAPDDSDGSFEPLADVSFVDQMVAAGEADRRMENRLFVVIVAVSLLIVIIVVLIVDT